MGAKWSTLSPEEIINRGGNLFDQELLDTLKEIRDSDLPFYSHRDIQIDANEPEKDCYIGIAPEHGYFLVKYAKDLILRYHIVLDNRNYRLARDDFTISYDTYVNIFKKHTLHKIGTTRLTIDQVDMLANYVIFDSYQLIRQDCLEYAKQFGKQIAMNENNKSEVEYRRNTDHLRVMGEGASGMSEAKSRRHRNGPKAWGMVWYGHAKNKDSSIQLVLGTVLVTCLSLKLLERVAGKLW